MQDGRNYLHKTVRTLVYISLILWLLIVTLPMIWLFYSSFKPSVDIMANSWSLPKAFDLRNYSNAWEKFNVGSYFINSLVVVGAALFMTTLVSSMAAYGLTRLKIKGSKFVYSIFILGMIVPTALTLVPLFDLLKKLFLLNSLFGLSLVYVGVSIPFSVLVLYGIFISLPEEVREAAKVDGASEWQTFWHIFLPMARPGIITVAIFNFIGMWNDYLLALVTLIDPEKQTLQLGIANMVVALNYKSDWGTLFATLVLTILPVLLIYAFVHKKVVEGMLMGSVKG
ncbi:MAG: hypothetical protein A2452_11645 [Candidatus Firestonebacteria bacterium RIFOXYC2_FULL_39_67]|nr:MAG: hypothetical protein A2536_07665 [Candidatus Firestonebacteria bacterium RIFOXYD2_FULL_39_29]OGF53876.1 MAG: hypothetical protein A2452_11645 [Candidatus Firestonebacteria bacterium RIFOXYC2_FULL_39_67]